VAVVIQLEPRGDRRKAEPALGLEELDAIRGGNGAFQRRGDKPAHQVGAGADVSGLNGDRGVFAAGILPEVQGANRLKAGDQDDEIHHHR